MKKGIMESIRELKRESEARSEDNRLSQLPRQQKMEKSPKKDSASNGREGFINKQGHGHSKGKMFKGLAFCFPVVDLELTPKQIELMSENIVNEGGKVVKFAGKAVSELVDYVAVNPKLEINSVISKIEVKLPYREIVDYHFITNSLKGKYLQNAEKYSLHINVQEFGFEEKGGAASLAPSKKQKKEEEESDSDRTVKLSDDQERPQIWSHKEHNQPNEHSNHSHSEKVDIQELILHEKKKEHNFSMNKFIADELTKLMKIYATERDLGRKMAYMKAASVIRGLDREIESEKDVENLRGIGDKISKKIKELLDTGKINKLETLQSSEKNIARGMLSEVWGIGPSKANELYTMGIKTLEDLSKRTDLLNRNQKIGLKYFEDLQRKIPREKVAKMFDFVRNIIETLVISLDMYCVEICGSYRRGSAECGDMDIIISRKDGVYEKTFLVDLVQELENLGFLTDHLTHPRPGEPGSSMTYMGVCQYQGPTHHRIDIKYYPIEEYAFAILHFTGNSTFNRMLRLHTMKLGLQLSDKGAVPKMEKGVIWDKPVPKCYTQQDIFRFLGLDYKTPLMRNL